VKAETMFSILEGGDPKVRFCYLYAFLLIANLIHGRQVYTSLYRLVDQITAPQVSLPVNLERFITSPTLENQL
jgi:hypothetical protein